MSFYEKNSYRIFFYTVGTDMNDGLKRYITSCNLHNIPYTILGLGEKWKTINFIREYSTTTILQQLELFQKPLMTSKNENLRLIKLSLIISRLINLLIFWIWVVAMVPFCFCTKNGLSK